MPTTIYALCDPCDGRVRYIGKTITSLQCRLNNHMYRARSGRAQSPLGVWCRGLLSRGQKPRIIPLESVPDTACWQEYERAWIARFPLLLNIHPGGNGAHTRAPLASQWVELLGQIPDSEIAERAGLARETIGYHRRRLGVPPCRVRKPSKTAFQRGQPAWNKKPASAALIAQLGTQSDRVLAKRFGVSRVYIRDQRLEYGIAPFTKASRRIPDATKCAIRRSTEPGVILAARYGISSASVSMIRRGRNENCSSDWA